MNTPSHNDDGCHPINATHSLKLDVPTPPPLYKLRKCPKLIPYAYCSLDTGVACAQHIQLPIPGAQVQKERIAW